VKRASNSEKVGHYEFASILNTNFSTAREGGMRIPVYTDASWSMYSDFWDPLDREWVFMAPASFREGSCVQGPEEYVEVMQSDAECQESAAQRGGWVRDLLSGIAARKKGLVKKC